MLPLPINDLPYFGVHFTKIEKRMYNKVKHQMYCTGPKEAIFKHWNSDNLREVILYICLRVWSESKYLLRLPNPFKDPWCSTKVDPSNNHHIEGGSYYGDCPSNCPLLPIVNKAPNISGTYYSLIIKNYLLQRFLALQ